MVGPIQSVTVRLKPRVLWPFKPKNRFHKAARLDPSTYSPAPTHRLQNRRPSRGQLLRGPIRGAIVSRRPLESPPWRNDVLGFSCSSCVELPSGGMREHVRRTSVWDGRWGLDRCQGDDKCEWCEKRWRHLYRDGFMGGGGTWFKEGATPTWQSLPLVCFMARFSTIPSPVT